MQIDWTLLLLLVVAALGVLGLVLALQTATGRKRLADAAMSLAEALLSYAIAWLQHDYSENNITHESMIDVISVAEASRNMLRDRYKYHAKAKDIR